MKVLGTLDYQEYECLMVSRCLTLYKRIMNIFLSQASKKRGYLFYLALWVALIINSYCQSSVHKKSFWLQPLIECFISWKERSNIELERTYSGVSADRIPCLPLQSLKNFFDSVASFTENLPTIAEIIQRGIRRNPNTSSTLYNNCVQEVSVNGLSTAPR